MNWMRSLRARWQRIPRSAISAERNSPRICGSCVSEGPARKATIWFSPPAKGQTRLMERNCARVGHRGHCLPGRPIAALQAAPRKDRSFGAMLSSWQVQTAIGIPLFAAALVVSLFAWREMRVQHPARRNISEAADGAGGAGSIPKNAEKQASDTGAADAADSSRGSGPGSCSGWQRGGDCEWCNFAVAGRSSRS